MSIESSASKKSVQAPFWLTAIAMCGEEIAVYDGESSRWWVVGRIAGFLLMMFLGARGFPALLSPENAPRYGVWGILGFAAFPWILEFVGRKFWQVGVPLEIQLLAALRNISVGLGCFSFRGEFARLSVVISMFLIIFSATYRGDPLVMVLVFVYSFVGIWWLMGNYWETVQKHLVGKSVSSPPVHMLVSIPLLLIACLLCVPVVSPSVARLLSGWVPSSGGTGASDPYARGGVNDGDALVPASESAKSFGPVESQVFLESQQPSLYDAMDDTYGKERPRRAAEKAVALPLSMMQRSQTPMAVSKSVQKEFSTLRQPRNTETKPLSNQASNALFYVGGRTPLHLKQESFDLFDGLSWSPEPLDEPPLELSIQNLQGQPWLMIGQPKTLEIYGPVEGHQLKILNLQTNRIPAPTPLRGVHIDRVDRKDFYQWVQNGIVALNRSTIPDMTVIHLQSQAVDPRLCLQHNSRFLKSGDRYHQSPEGFERSAAADLARRWTEGIPEGMRQIEAIIDHLRTEYQLDPDYRAPVGTVSTAADFLTNSKRGPDYLFATSAALLLRSRGYGTRLVSGFYVSPKKYDVKQRYTPVEREDVHFWLEVYLGGGTWIPLEPTPGYERLAPPKSFSEYVAAILGGIVGHVRQHLVTYALAAGFLLLLIRYRRSLVELWLMLRWNCSARLPWQQRIRLAAGILEYRAKMFGVCRTRDQTHSMWLREFHRPLSRPEELGELESFSRAIDRADYAPENSPSSVGELERTCRSVLQRWPRRRYRRAIENRSSGQVTTTMPG
ncbi:MAG: transglutaminase-like domain-containing protein [Planctomycetales bacterium]